jgi:deoxyribonuclease V
MPRHLQKDWNLSPTEAVATQQRLRHEVRIEPLEREVRFIGGADVSFNRFSDKIYTGIVVLDLATLKVVESVGVRSVARFPYIPGLMLDGQGIAHPRRFGIACHIGVLLDLPTVGCAKSLLVGHHDDLPTAAGKHVPLIHREEEIGVALRTKRNVAPIFVSVGHLIDLPSAIEIVKKSTGKYRQPEPTRQAHLLVNQLRRDDDAKAAKAGASQ